MSLVALITAAMATSALTYYLVEEDGPWELIRKLRWRLGVNLVLDRVTGITNYVDEYAVHKDMEGLQMEYAPNGSVPSLILSCTNCLSVYTSLFFTGWVISGMENLSWGKALYWFPLVWGFLAGTSLYVNLNLRGNYAHN